MNTLLYCCLLQEESQMTSLFRAAAAAGASYDDFRASPEPWVDSHEVTFSAGPAEAKLTAGSAEERLELHHGRYRFLVRFSVTRVTPENVGLCWDCLVAAVLGVGCTVWLSEKTADVTTLSRIAPIREANIADGGRGVVLEADEFLRLVEA